MRPRREFFLILMLSMAMLFASPMKEKEIKLDLLSEIQGRGDIIFAVEKEQYPYIYRDGRNKLTGFCIDLAKAIAEEMGSKASFVEKDEDLLWAGLYDGRYDLVMNIHNTLIKQNREFFESTSAYLPIKAAIVKKNDNVSIFSASDLRDRSTAIMRDPEYVKIAEKYNAMYISLEKEDEILRLVESGSLEAAICPFEMVAEYLRNNKDSKLTIVDATKDISDSLAISLRKEDSTKDMRRAVNKAISELKKDGKLSTLSTKYFHYDLFKK